jgi:hypothetical protein
MGWAIEVGVPFVVKSWDRVHVLLRPGLLYDSQEVQTSDPGDPFESDETTTIALTAELEAEVFIVSNFSVSASHGIGYFNVDPAGGGEGESSWSTLGADFSHIGFHRARQRRITDRHAIPKNSGDDGRSPSRGHPTAEPKWKGGSIVDSWQVSSHHHRRTPVPGWRRSHQAESRILHAKI